MSMREFTHARLNKTDSQVSFYDNLQVEPVLNRKFHTSMEKKFEALQLGSKLRGWSYDDFVIHVLEVLTVLHHRNKVPSTTQAPDRKSSEA
jgi:hypothetical protein